MVGICGLLMVGLIFIINYKNQNTKRYLTKNNSINNSKRIRKF